MKITGLTIENFRSIKTLSISHFSKFNLILGENNSGKSSILEALQFCSALPTTMLPNQLNTIRKLMSNDISSAFHNLDETKPIVFSIASEDGLQRNHLILGNINRKMKAQADIKWPFVNQNDGFDIRVPESLSAQTGDFFNHNVFKKIFSQVLARINHNQEFGR